MDSIKSQGLTDAEKHELCMESGREWARREAMCDAEEAEQASILDEEAERMDEVAWTRVWVTDKGEKIPFEAMTGEHLQNTIGYLEKCSHPSHMEVALLMKEELERRGGDNEKAICC